MKAISPPKSKQLSLEDAGELMSKFLSVISDEADRLLAIPVEDRKPADIKTALSCLNSLNAINKDTNTEVIEYRKQIQLLPYSVLPNVREDAGSSKQLDKYTESLDGKE